RQTVPTDYQVSLAHAWIDAGADVVWGHHPHVLQGTEIYKGRPILYSMGNLVSSLGAKTGLALLTFDNKKFLGLRGVPCVISGGKVR
ncbi:CapA family protein, partial [Shewanella algae]|uniref:CapA family protein n=1 Tax=Shewanella algae TaxID=38313 RepID=UPI003CC7AFCE